MVEHPFSMERTSVIMVELVEEKMVEMVQVEHLEEDRQQIHPQTPIILAMVHFLAIIMVMQVPEAVSMVVHLDRQANPEQEVPGISEVSPVFREIRSTIRL